MASYLRVIPMASNLFGVVLERAMASYLRVMAMGNPHTYIYILSYIIYMYIYTYDVLSALFSLVPIVLAVHVLSVLALDVLSSML